MRNQLGLLLFVAGIGAYGALDACGGAPQIVVEPNAPGAMSTPEQGDTIKFTRKDSERYAGHSPGFFVVRSPEEWDRFWADAPQGTKPARPLVNFDEQMLAVGYAKSSDAAELRFMRVVDTGGSIHIYVEERTAGAGCPPKEDGPYDVIAIERSDKTTHFHIDRLPLDACNTAAPTGKIICRKAGAVDWSERIKAVPGETIECEADKSKSKNTAADSNWLFSELPPGSMAKLSFSREGQRVSFPIDTFGHFVIGLELSDDQGHSSTASTTIESLPPPGEPFLELVWTHFDPNDDPSTFPRIQLHVTEVTKRVAEAAKTHSAKDAGAPPPPAKGADCTIDAPVKPPWCDIKVANFLTLLHFHPTPAAGYEVDVHYDDDRYVGGPVPCVRGFLDGKATADRCDRLKRDADSTWHVGILEGNTAAFIPEGESLGSSIDGGAPPNVANDGGSRGAQRDARAPMDSVKK
jgi:hypothetical protein